MQRFGGVEEQGHQADGRKGGCNLARHDSAFAHTGDHQRRFAIGAAFQQSQGRFHMDAVQAISWRSDGVGFHLQAAGESGHLKKTDDYKEIKLKCHAQKQQIERSKTMNINAKTEIKNY